VVLEDFAAMLGLVFAFLGIFLGHLLNNPYLDGIASIAIGLLLMSVAGSWSRGPWACCWARA
jgi:divalent metal cation (Fe/Co/Zn/Cd) transporter